MATGIALAPAAHAGSTPAYLCYAYAKSTLQSIMRIHMGNAQGVCRSGAGLAAVDDPSDPVVIKSADAAAALLTKLQVSIAKIEEKKGPCDPDLEIDDLVLIAGEDITDTTPATVSTILEALVEQCDELPQ